MDTAETIIDLATLGRFTFKKPLPCHIYHEFDEVDMIVAENKNLSLVGCGETKEEAINQFKGHLIAFLLGMNYFHKDAVTTETCKRIYNDLREYFDPDDYTEKWLWDEMETVG